MTVSGRSCPIDYSLSKHIFEKDSTRASTLYVVGGLYGNMEALREIEDMAMKDDNPLIVLNGDIHWFDKTVEDFKAIENIVKNHIPLIGNVEAELRRTNDSGVGCGCAYPGYVSDATVERSNNIHSQLKEVMNFIPEIKESLKKRPSTEVVEVSDVKVFITHGDEKSIAGWGLSRESLSSEKRREEVKSFMEENSIDIIASTHTCSPVCVSIGNRVIINNGASGMPNFKGELYGLITRISTTKCEDAIYRKCISGVFIEGVPVRYNRERFINWFDNLWEEDSAAAISYRNRIVNGTNTSISDAILGGFSIIK